MPGRARCRELKNGFRVILGSFLLFFIVDGITYSYGILMLELLTSFNSGRGETALVGSLLSGSMALTGPLAGFLCETYGYRLVVISGSLLSTIGFLGAMFSTQIFHLYIAYGLVSGVGFGMMFLVANSCIIGTFTKNVSVAAGLAICGSGVGNFTINHLTRLSIDMYGWRGTLLIQAGVTLHGLVCGLLMVPRKPGAAGIREITVPIPAENEAVPSEKDTCFNQLDDILTRSQCSSDPVVIDTTGVASEDIDIINEGFSGEGDATRWHDEPHNADISKGATCEIAENRAYRPAAELIITHGPTANIMNEVHNEARDKYISNGRKSKLPQNSSKCTATSRSTVSSACNSMFDLHLLSNIRFLVVLASLGFVSLAFYIPYHLIPDQIDQMEISRAKSTWLTSAIGTSNTVGRLIFGLLGNLSRSKRTVLVPVLLLVIGIITGLSPFLTTFETKLLYGCCFGLLIGGFFALLPVVMADMFGASLISRTFGLTMFTVGVFASVATPIGGWIRDSTGSYTITFLVAGGEFILGSAALFAARFLKRPT